MYKDRSGPRALPAPILLPRLGAVLSTGALPWAQGQRKPRSTTDLESALGEGGFNNHEKKIITCHILNMTSKICLKAWFFSKSFSPAVR